MYGPPADYNNNSSYRDNDNMGLIPRAVNEIFELANSKEIIEYSIYCSFVQIYNENLYDMLR